MYWALVRRGAPYFHNCDSKECLIDGGQYAVQSYLVKIAFHNYTFCIVQRSLRQHVPSTAALTNIANAPFVLRCPFDVFARP
jgi:hypothetical protein